ncbi:hypothetical protein GCM10012282_14800 [Streptomyces lacrimifluminis]|uniref:Uncharacterized protein n=1 Tax=Streptomyces lacrimifluminis TaxID=1500077 RepID=A0A917KQD5_9ACTN|nr:hypothetical protein GCM10012282_14800 [Streptomyces lacrimifluminis]
MGAASPSSRAYSPATRSNAPITSSNGAGLSLLSRDRIAAPTSNPWSVCRSNNASRKGSARFWSWPKRFWASPTRCSSAVRANSRTRGSAASVRAAARPYSADLATYASRTGDCPAKNAGNLGSWTAGSACASDGCPCWFPPGGAASAVLPVPVSEASAVAAGTGAGSCGFAR